MTVSTPAHQPRTAAETIRPQVVTTGPPRCRRCPGRRRRSRRTGRATAGWVRRTGSRGRRRPGPAAGSSRSGRRSQRTSCLLDGADQGQGEEAAGGDEGGGGGDGGAGGPEHEGGAGGEPAGGARAHGPRPYGG